jgi:hypothetical protein
MSLLSQEIQPNGIQIPPLQTLALNSVCRNPSILKTRKINNLPYPLLEALFLRLQREYKIRLELLPHFRNLQKCSLVTSATHDMELQNGWIEEFTHWESLKYVWKIFIPHLLSDTFFSLFCQFSFTVFSLLKLKIPMNRHD